MEQGMNGQPSIESNNKLLVRHAGEDDVAAITGLINAAFQVERFFLGSDRIGAEEVRARIAGGTFVLLENGDGLVGCVYVELRGESGFIGLLSVEPRCQKSGFGRMLMNAAEDYFRKNGCRQAELRVVNLRVELPPYYRHLGYREIATEELPAEIARILPCHLIVMTKALI
jgi:N-acetylglutamate synthase-like GNAT family acetyltransferase